MPEIVNMEVTLRNFSHAVQSGLPLQRCSTDETVFVHPDNPKGVFRYTFCKTENNKPTSIVALCQTEHIDGQPCFNIGYATDISHRKKGLAKSLLKAAIYDLSEGLKRQGIEDFYLEAGVEISNVVSQKICSDVLKVAPIESHDPNSGTPTLGYICKVSSLDFVK